MSSIPQQIGNYKLERKLGRGASGEVWLARHSHLQARRVAIKILLSQDQETLQRFQREASIASLLQHQNIVQVYDHGSYISSKPPGQFHCTIMEYVHGSSLQQVLDGRKRLPLSEALDIFCQLAAALDYAHRLDIIHRDVSPGNVLIEQSSGRVLLSDFGIARDLSHHITVSSAVMGTPGYWSPEHTRSATEVTHLSDIFGLGILLYVMLSGELPWGEDAGLHYQGVGAPPPLKERGIANLPPEMDQVLKTLLAIEPAKRYQSAGEAMRQIDAIMQRHHTVTRITMGLPRDDGTPQTVQTARLDGLEPDAIEQVLGADMQRALLSEARQRAEELRDPAEIRCLLDEWAAAGRLRRNLLGRLARLHRVSSRNIYFYRLRVLYEQRGAIETSEEPDYDEQVFPLEPERSRWQVPLPAVQGFAPDAGGQEVLPGSCRVVRCDDCAGRGKHICPMCQGKQRVYEQQALDEDSDEALALDIQAALLAQEQGRSGNVPGQATLPVRRMLVPCPECGGTGGFTCERCDGVGRLVQRSTFVWQRFPRSFADHDDLPDVDDRWLHKHCELHDVYCETADAATYHPAAALRSEWFDVPPLAALLEQAQAAASEHTRIVLSELSIGFLPVTDIVFDLGQQDEQNEAGLYRLTIYGFENAIPPDWRFLNWERVVFLCVLTFMFALLMVLAFFALMI
jgi:predicted Ser/Thr protein kinase